MPPSNCFETGRRSPTQSSVRPFGPRQQMDVWFSIEEKPPPRGAKASWRDLKTFVSAPPERVRRVFALLTRTYHGCRLHGSYPETALCEVKDGVLDVWSATWKVSSGCRLCSQASGRLRLPIASIIARRILRLRPSSGLQIVNPATRGLDRSAWRAKRHAQPQLSGTLRHRIRHHAIQSDDCEQQR